MQKLDGPVFVIIYIINMPLKYTCKDNHAT